MRNTMFITFFTTIKTIVIMVVSTTRVFEFLLNTHIFHARFVGELEKLLAFCGASQPVMERKSKKMSR